MNLSSNEHQYWMQIALDMAKKALTFNEVPVGAVIVKDNKIISSAHNYSISKNDPTAHAEILAIRAASIKIENYRLVGSSIYVTLEPCSMCYGAIVHSRISNIFFGARDKKSGVCGSCDNFWQKEYFNHKPQITGQILEKDCSRVLKDFFKTKRN